MLTPTDIHIIVGLLTRVTSPDSVEIMLGDIVYDIRAEEGRDVDVTVTYKDLSGLVSAFKGIEVKKHGRPLDVIHVEQLCIKLNDMPDISHKAIVSASGYTKPARKKAKAYKVDLYSLIPWGNTAEGFEHVQFPSNFAMQHRGLSWISLPSVNFELDNQNPNQNIEINKDTPICNITGGKTDLETLQRLADKLSSIALQQLINNEEVKMLSPGVEKYVMVPFNLSDIFIILGNSQKQLKQALVQGGVVWKETNLVPEFKILVKDGEKTPDIGIAITEMPQGNLMGITVSHVDRVIKLINIPVSERNIMKIQKLKLK